MEVGDFGLGVADDGGDAAVALLRPDGSQRFGDGVRVVEPVVGIDVFDYRVAAGEEEIGFLAEGMVLASGLAVSVVYDEYSAG